MNDARNIRRFPTPKRRKVRMLPIAIAAIILLGFVLAAVLRFWVDYLWFSELHQAGVFTTRLKWSLIVGITVAVITFAAIYASLYIALRVARDDLYAPFLSTPRR